MTTLRMVFTSAFYNCTRTIHFQPLNYSFTLRMEGTTWIWPFAQVLLTITSKVGHLLGMCALWFKELYLLCTRTKLVTGAATMIPLWEKNMPSKVSAGIWIISYSKSILERRYGQSYCILRNWEFRFTTGFFWNCYNPRISTNNIGLNDNKQK